MLSRNLEMLLEYSVEDWVGRRDGRSVNPMQVTPCQPHRQVSVFAVKDRLPDSDSNLRLDSLPYSDNEVASFTAMG